MRILLVSDLHYSLPQFDWVVAASPSFDVVVVAGDSLNINSPVPLDAQSVVVHRYLSLIAGRDPAGRELGQSRPDRTRRARASSPPCGCAIWQAASMRTDGDSLLLDDTLITICPWWDGPLGRADVVSQLSSRCGSASGARGCGCTTGHRIGSPTCWTGRRDYGDPDLREWIEEFQPDIVLAGHVHESPFKSDGSWMDRIGNTWVFNAGHQIGKVPGVHRARPERAAGPVDLHHGDRVARPARTRLHRPGRVF